jgi:hypothetical protein
VNEPSQDYRFATAVFSPKDLIACFTLSQPLVFA